MVPLLENSSRGRHQVGNSFWDQKRLLATSRIRFFVELTHRLGLVWKTLDQKVSFGDPPSFAVCPQETPEGECASNFM